MIYTFVYFKKNFFPKHALIFQTLQKFGNFCHFREVFFNVNFFLNLPEDSKYRRNLVIFSSLFFVIFFNFVVSLTNYTHMEYSKTLPDMIT